MKTPPKKKNSRRLLAGLPAIVLRPQRAIKPFDNEQFVLKTKSQLKEVVARDPSMMHPQAVQEMAVWNPPKVTCSKCGWKGTLVECGRTYFPPDNIGWDCGNPKHFCDHRLVPGVDYPSSR
jgi:hypothetical protein